MPARDVTIRPLAEADLDAADRVMRVAFGTFVGLPDPTAFLGDGRYVHHRFRADPASAFVAVADGEVVGSNFVSVLAASRGATMISAGVNTACHETYEWMLTHGFRTEILGVAMHRPNEPAFSRPGVWVLGDWR